MLGTYTPTLRGNVLIWEDEAPLQSDPERAVKVMVTVLENAASSQVSDGVAMAEALAQLAALPDCQLPEDAANWQREIRQDRNLPGRE